MPNPWDKITEPPPPSEVNPLTNPLLERNLGRWAKVYFGNPPGRRDQAVGKLLEEIKRENSLGPAANVARHNFDRDTKLSSGVCPGCLHQNPPGHKFCSRCGKVLGAPLPSQAAEDPAPGATIDATPPPQQSENDVQWLRNRSFASMDEYDVPQRRGWKYLAGALVIVLAGLAYLQWFSGSRTKVGSSTPAVSPMASRPSSADASPPTQQILPPEKAEPAVQPDPHSAAADTRTRTPAPIQQAMRTSSLLEAPSSPLSGSDSGAPDLRLAQRYLGGSMGVRDSAEAAKLLWKAVSKQNATAAILLSDLYMRGDGVPRSCDQARLLLVAAARRGSPQAAQQLRNLESHGCQ